MNETVILVYKVNSLYIKIVNEHQQNGKVLNTNLQDGHNADKVLRLLQ